MKFFAINGSPRKACNTAQLLKESLKGIKSEINKKYPDEDVELKFINLYSLNYKGCNSCMACKRLNNKNYGKCAMKDELTPLLDDLTNADGVIIGSPIYLGDVTGMVRCFYERFLFPYLSYTKVYTSLAPKKFPLGTILTMNLDENSNQQKHYDSIIKTLDRYYKIVYSSSYFLKVVDTVQVKDYSKYKIEAFNGEHKNQRRKEQFPKDLKSAFNMGVKIANDAIKK
jgi:multimeric flavodoxin WrbA